MTATSCVSFQTGCWPHFRSMMLSRRMPSANPGARLSLTRNPSSSGPRCCSAAVIALTRVSASLVRLAKAIPQMPHTLLLDLRNVEKRRARALKLRSQAESPDSQTIICVPPQQNADQNKEERRRYGNAQCKKRFALQQQAPVHRFLPVRESAVQKLPQVKPFHRQPRQTHVRYAFIIIFLR